LQEEFKTEKVVKEFRKEMELCMRIHHPNIVLFMGGERTFFSSSSFNLNFCFQGSLEPDNMFFLTEYPSLRSRFSLNGVDL